VPILVWSAPDRIQVLSDDDEAAIRDQRTAGGVHNDVRLVGCQYPVAKRSRTITYPPEVPVNDVAGVKITEAFRDVGYLGRG